MKLYITNKPAFYKVLLFNRINEREEIFVIYTTRNLNDGGRNADFNVTASGGGTR